MKLEELVEIALEENWSDDEFYREALERGFTPEDFPDTELVADRMESYGLI